MRYLHTMLRTSDVTRTRAFLEALGYELVRELPHVRGGVQEATNFFFRLPGDTSELEVSLPVQQVDPPGAWGHVALGVTDLNGTLAHLAGRGIEPTEPPRRVREGGPRLCLIEEPSCGHLFELVETGG